MAVHKQYMWAMYQRFCFIKDIAELAELLEVSQLQLNQLRFDKPYTLFEVKKQSGKYRLIENPHSELKAVLRKLGFFLQCCYYFNRTGPAYGFLQQPRNAARKKSILTNAKVHCNKKYMLNLDLEDFFHQVSKIKVTRVFKEAPFNFSTALSGFIAELSTYKNRLPMGSPTSPVLSNFCTRETDKELELLAREHRITYTRYVDDLTFSSNQPINADIFYGIQQILATHSYRINAKKICWMGADDEKIVTGLILKNKPEVSSVFLDELENNINRLKHVIEFSAISHVGASLESVKAFKMHLLGKLRFLQMVYGSKHEVYVKMTKLYYEAFNAQPFAESFNWNSFPYY